MNIMEKMKEIIEGYPELNVFADTLQTDLHTPGDQNVVVLADNGDVLNKRYLYGAQVRTHNFVLQLYADASLDVERVNNSGWLLRFHLWLEEQKAIWENEKMTYTIEEIAPANGGLFMLVNDDINDKVVYQLDIRVVYKVQPE